MHVPVASVAPTSEKPHRVPWRGLGGGNEDFQIFEGCWGNNIRQKWNRNNGAAVHRALHMQKLI